MSLASRLNFIHRVIGASRFDTQTYEEVEADHTALGQAIGVVVVSSLAAGIGIGGTAAAALAVDRALVSAETTGRVQSTPGEDGQSGSACGSQRKV
jgi:hypothetical protein